MRLQCVPDIELTWYPEFWLVLFMHSYSFSLVLLIGCVHHYSAWKPSPPRSVVLSNRHDESRYYHLTGVNRGSWVTWLPLPYTTATPNRVPLPVTTEHDIEAYHIRTRSTTQPYHHLNPPIVPARNTDIQECDRRRPRYIQRSKQLIIFTGGSRCGLPIERLGKMHHSAYSHRMFPHST